MSITTWKTEYRKMLRDQIEEARSTIEQTENDEEIERLNNIRD